MSYRPDEYIAQGLVRIQDVPPTENIDAIPGVQRKVFKSGAHVDENDLVTVERSGSDIFIRKGHEVTELTGQVGDALRSLLHDRDVRVRAMYAKIEGKEVKGALLEYDIFHKA